MKFRLSGALILFIPLFLFTANSSAFEPPSPAPLPNFDKRTDGLQAGDIVSENQRAAVGQLRLRLSSVRVDFDPVTGAPKIISAGDKFLSGTNGQGHAISASSYTGIAPDDQYRVTKAFLKEHGQLFGFGPEALDQARVARDFITPHSGLKTVVWEQQVDGIRVFEAVLISHTTTKGELVNIGSQFVADAGKAADQGTPNRTALETAPAITAPQAVALAALNVGDDLKPEQVTPSAPLEAGAEQKQKFTAPALQGETEAKLTWLPMNKQTLRLCWDVILMSRGRNAMFRILVDTQTGEVLLRHCLTDDLSDATYRVYTSDSPSPFSPGWSTPSSVQPPLTSRVLVTWSALDTNASPAGWINDGDNQTLGNNVDAHTDWNNDDLPDLPRPQGSPFRVFDFPMDLTTQDPTSYAAAAVVQLFYWNNFMHDKLYALGFTEAAGNFQNNNFGRGGLGNDAVQADAQDGGGFNNANFSTPPDGSVPRMQMYIFNGPSPRRDGDLDAEVMLHEYTHGLSNRRVGGGVGISALQSGGMGEGWSDFYAMALLSEPGDDVNGVYAYGGYVTYQLSGLTQNYYFGIRRYPYCTDMSKNPLTFKDIDPAQASSHSGIPRSPIIGNTANEVHNMGEVWCMTLREARASLINKYGWAVGNPLILQLVTDGMNLSPPNPNFLQARDAILQADLVDTEGANQHELWAAFAKRGMGFSATSPSSSTTTGVHEAYDIPDDLHISPTDGFTSSGPVGGPFSPDSITFALTNVGSNSLGWTLVNTATWLNVLPASGTLNPGGPAASVTASLTAPASSLPMGVYTSTVWFTNLNDQAVQGRQFTLRVGQPDYYTELFDTTTNDVAYKTFTFTPDGSANFYSVCRLPAVAFPTDPAGGTPVSLTDDSYSPVTLSGGNTVAIYGTRSGVFYIGSNGYLTMNSGDTTYTESLSAHFSLPRVSALFDDLNPGAGGTISWKQLSDRVAVTYQNVPEYGTADMNSFQMELFYDGRIRLTCLRIDATDGLVGLSAGTGVPVNFQESDFSAYELCSLLSVQLPASATEGCGVLTNAGSVWIGGVLPTNLVVSLTSSVPVRLTVPASATITAGQLHSAFNLNVVDNSIHDGDQTVTVTANAPGLGNASASMLIMDDDVPPQILIQPSGQTVPVGNLAVFSVTATGKAPLGYFWWRDGTPIAGANGTSYTTNNVQLADSGSQYSCLVSNAYGAVLSSNALLTVVTGAVDVITFDDLPDTTSGLEVPAGYHGLTWNNFWELDGLDIPGSGYEYGVVSGSNVVFNMFGDPASITMDSPFTLVSAYLTAAWTADLQVRVKGYVWGVLTYDQTYTLSATAPTLVTFNYSGVTEVDFSASDNFVMDNVAILFGPPGIVVQPTNQTVVLGETANFGVTASGPPPLSYRWYFNEENIDGATNASLTLTNVQLNQAGNYAVLVTNFYGSVLSSNAILTVNLPSTNCTPAPSGLVSWWPAEGNANDIVGTNDGVLVGGMSYGAGEVGQAFYSSSLNGPGVRIPASPDLDVGAGNGFTLEAWINPTDVTQQGPIFEWNVGDGATYWGVHFHIDPFSFEAGPGALYANIISSDGGWNQIHTAGGAVTNNGFQHVALTYDQTTGLATIYRNGVMMAQQYLGVFTPLTTYDLYLGRRPLSPGADQSSFLGSIDEPAVYNRALSSNEIAAIYNAGTGGKCPPSPTPPSITTQPTNQTVAVGDMANFGVTASGTPPLSYQWYFNGTNLSGATNTSLTLANVQLNQAGNYAVLVTNAFGSALSSNAVLTVVTGAVDVITFDDLPDTMFGLEVPAGYHGLTWNNFYELDGLDIPGSGYQYGVVSASNVAFNAYGNPASITKDSPFTLVSAYLTAAWDPNLQVRVMGYVEGVLAYDQTYTLSMTVPTLVTFNYGGVTEVDFSPSDYTQFAMDNVTILTGNLLPSNNVPVITGFSPASGLAGVSVTIIGTNFSSVAANNTVYFGAVQAQVAAASPTSLVVTVPVGATYAPITEMVDGLTAYANQPFLPTFPGIGQMDNSSLAPRLDLATDNGPGRVVIADLDGDGKPDLIIADSYAGVISIYQNISTNGLLTADSFAPRVDLPMVLGTYDNPYTLAVADLDGDGKLDIIAVNADSDIISVFRNISSLGTITTNSFADRVDFPAGNDVRGIAVQDLNGDGKPEIVTGNAGDNTISIFQNISTIGNIAFAARVDLAAGNGPEGVAIGDLDGDGIPDLAVANVNSGTISVFRNLGIGGDITTSSFAPRVDYPGLASVGCVAIGDMDGDGKLDIVAGGGYGSQAISVYRNTATAGSITSDSFAPRVDFDAPGWVNSLTLGDLDGDGRLDVALVSQIPSVFSIFKNVSVPGSFTTDSLAARVDFDSGWNPNGVAMGDLDGDGRPDVLFCNQYDGTVSIYQNEVPFGAPPCVPAPTNLISWWPGEGNANDIIGTNNGILENVTFASGMVSQGFYLNGSNADVQVPDSASLKPASVTVETWVKLDALASPVAAYPGLQYIIFKQNTRDGNFEGYDLEKNRIAGQDLFRFQVTSADGTQVPAASTTVPQVGVWYHLAGTYDSSSGYVKLYVNGILEGSAYAGFPLDYGTRPVFIGTSGQSWWDGRVQGTVDEVSIYNRALSASEIQAIYNAGSAGKCAPVAAPVILSQPTNQTVAVWGAATFTVVAEGTPPLSYQWYFNEENIDGATNNSLTLTNVQLNQAGNYAVLVTNAYGSILSSNAALTVVEPVIGLLWDVDFQGGTNSAVSQEVGFAVAGQTANDFWNCYTRDDGQGGWRYNGSLTNLSLADGTITPVGLMVTNGPGAWTSGSSDAMYNAYIYPFSGIMTVTVTNLPEGIYEILPYANDASFELSVGSGSYGVRACHDYSPSGTPVWMEGVQYVRYTNVQVHAGQPLVLTVSPGVGGYASLAGMQIAQVEAASAFDHFVWNPIPSPRFVNTPFAVTIRAQNLTNGIFTNFTGIAILGSTNGVAVTPSVSGNFVQGAWTGAVVISQTGSNLVLQADDGLGHFGLANPINVINLPSLSMLRSGNIALYIWPVGYSGFVLETSGCLSPATWVVVPYSPIQVGDQYLLPLHMTGTNGFYRLWFPGP